MSKELKRHITSFGITFVASFLGIFSSLLTLQNHDTLSITLVGSLLISAMRSAVKVTFEAYTEKAK